MNTNHWFMWAILSACFAALTAIFAKVGLRQVNSDLATLIRTVIIRSLAKVIIASLSGLRVQQLS
jgi:transporter family protein